MRKTVISSTKPIIWCKQVKPRDVHRPHLNELLDILIKEGYNWARHPDDYLVYRIKCEGEQGIGVSAAEGEYVCTDLRNKDADGFWLDDANVRYTPMSDKDSLRMSNRKAKELGIKHTEKIRKPKYRLCPGCKELAPYDRKRDFKNADNSDEQQSFKECRLCGHKTIVKTRETEKKKRLNALFKELV